MRRCAWCVCCQKAAAKAKKAKEAKKAEAKKEASKKDSAKKGETDDKAETAKLEAESGAANATTVPSASSFPPPVRLLINPTSNPRTLPSCPS